MRVLLATGSSGGHIFPALALSDSLKTLGHEVLLVLPQKSQENKNFIASVPVKYIHPANLSFNLTSKNVLGVYFLLLGGWQGLRIILKFKPDVVAGFGSLNTVGLIFWAWLFRVKTIIHEQNVVPGRANRCLAKLVDKVAVSFSQTGSYLNISTARISQTGNPIRKALVRLNRQEALDFFKFQEGKINILITGGSQGSHKLNLTCLAGLSMFQAKDKLQVIHISGSGDLAALQAEYSSLPLDYRLFDFISSMQYAYSVADLVICRAGATTIAELQRFRVPAILIPYPFAYAHQLANARVLEGFKAAMIIRDEDFTPGKLSATLGEFLENPQKIKTMAQSYPKTQILDAAEMLAREVLSLN
jgi:UDP-N-acetylglucosamine--N-acetylmuramyl-(pentapeptide) pyrophosphoryl-undecaprenol N-acetylglucosamine transferase